MLSEVLPTFQGKSSPALAADCSVIVKPAEEASLTALRVAERTILDVTDLAADQAREEIFGLALSAFTVEGFDAAIALANDTEYGLDSSMFTANVKSALRGARAIRAGTVTINSFGEGDISTTFGSFKSSGFGGRDYGIHAHDQYTQIKTIWVDLSDDADQAVA